MEKNFISIETLVGKPVSDVWACWTDPAHIVNWYFASEDWHCPKAENDLNAGGNFSIRMEAKDGSFGFDFGGVYDVVVEDEYIEYTLGDDRKVKIVFTELGSNTHIEQEFEAETQNSLELQEKGWQAILDHFKAYAESL